jgi:hypothetical protein
MFGEQSLVTRSSLAEPVMSAAAFEPRTSPFTASALAVWGMSTIASTPWLIHSRAIVTALSGLSAKSAEMTSTL